MQLTSSQRAAINAAAANRAYMRRTGLNYAGQKLWTEAEARLILLHHPDYEALIQLLPGRTRRAIQQKARDLGVAKDRRIWREWEEKIMRPAYVRGDPIDDIVVLLDGKTKTQVWAKASKRKIRRPRRRPKLLDLPVIDDVRQRAFDLHLTMRDLDEIAGIRPYFGKPSYYNWRALAAAIQWLGGTPRVTWHVG
jgi:hypothetical protein